MHAFRLHSGSIPMTTTITVREVPDSIAKKLKARAERNHRSLQGEIMAILFDAAAAAPRIVAERQTVYVIEPAAVPEQAGNGVPVRKRKASTDRLSGRRLSLRDLWERGKASGLSTPSESVEMIREDRDSR